MAGTGHARPRALIEGDLRATELNRTSSWRFSGSGYLHPINECRGELRERNDPLVTRGEPFPQPQHANSCVEDLSY